MLSLRISIKEAVLKKLVLLVFLFSLTLFAREPQEIINTICSTCHGFNMEKKCFSVSEIPNTLSSSYILEALTKYRAGKKNDYRMGSTMTAETSTLTDEEIKALSIYVKALGKKRKKKNKILILDMELKSLNSV